MLFRKRNRPRKRHRIRKLRLLALLALLGVLGLAAFTAGMMKALAQQVPAFNPLNQKTLKQNTYIYASDGHTVLAILRGDQARVVIPSEKMSPLIKQAMNQGYETIEYLLGNPIKPADHPLLEEKFRALPFAMEVDEVLDLMRDRVPMFGQINPLLFREFMLDSQVLAPE